MQTEDAPELTPEFLEDLRRYTEYGWGPGITAALLNRWHPVALTNLDVIRLRRRLGRAAAPVQDTGGDEPPRHCFLTRSYFKIYNLVTTQLKG